MIMPEDFDSNIPYIAFLNSMTKQERLAWLVATDNERSNRMARGRKPKAATQAEQLTKALNFVKIGTNDFLENNKFVRLSDGWATASNGQITAGHSIVEELDICPQLERLLAALNRCGSSLVIAETPARQLSIKGEKLKALIPCLAEGEEFFIPEPDASIAPINDNLKLAFKTCGILTSEAGTRVVEASLLLEANVCTGTDGAALVQYWHGIDLPPAIVLPKLFTQAVAACEIPLASFGYGWDGEKVSSVTFYFENGAWIKTQCYADRWPEISPIIDHNSQPVEVIGGLFEAIEAVTQFNDDGFVSFGNEVVQSHESADVGAQYEVKGLQGGKKFDGALLKKLSPLIKTLDITTYNDRGFFFGDNLRGVVMCMKIIQPEDLNNVGWGTTAQDRDYNEGD